MALGPESLGSDARLSPAELKQRHDRQDATSVLRDLLPLLVGRSVPGDEWRDSLVSGAIPEEIREPLTRALAGAANRLADSFDSPPSNTLLD